jgi:hypothetical protein
MAELMEATPAPPITKTGLLGQPTKNHHTKQ